MQGGSSLNANWQAIGSWKMVSGCIKLRRGNTEKKMLVVLKTVPI